MQNGLLISKAGSRVSKWLLWNSSFRLIQKSLGVRLIQRSVELSNRKYLSDQSGREPSFLSRVFAQSRRLSNEQKQISEESQDEILYPGFLAIKNLVKTKMTGETASFICRPILEFGPDDGKIERDVSELNESLRHSLSKRSAQEAGSLTFTLMTYNTLAQSNIRRELFPDSGLAIRWNHRGPALCDEIKHYRPTIFCAQEVDTERVPTFFSPLLTGLGYEFIFSCNGKSHGLLIAWNRELFTLDRKEEIWLDDLEPEPRIRTRNIGLAVKLRKVGAFSNHQQAEKLAKQQTDAQDNAICVATAHLYWHPQGCFERVRQGALLVRECEILAESKNCPIFIAGDFNTEPSDPNYGCLTRRPLKLSDNEKRLLHESFIYENAFWGQKKQDSAKPTAVQEDDEVQKLLELHLQNSPLVSSYGSMYDRLDPLNCLAETSHPPFTNWAATYTGMLDYIFVVRRSACSREREIAPGIVLDGLLKLPTTAEMSGGEPQLNRYPSDHLAIMGKFTLLSQ